MCPRSTPWKRSAVGSVPSANGFVSPTPRSARTSPRSCFSWRPATRPDGPSFPEAAMSMLKSRRVPVASLNGNSNGNGNGNGGPIRVVIVENHQLVSESLALLLDGQKDMEVVGTAASVGEASALPKELSADVVVMDFHLGDGTGHDAALPMRDSFPNVRFVFLSRDDSDDARLAAVEAGASAYLHKSSPASDVIDTIRKVAAGEVLITPGMGARLA